MMSMLCMYNVDTTINNLMCQVHQLYACYEDNTIYFIDLVDMHI